MGVGSRLLGARLGLPPPSGTVLFAEIAAMAASLGMFALTRRTDQDAAELLDRGLVYEVGMGFLIAVTYHCWPAPPDQMPKGWSPVAVWLVAFALLVPATRGKNALATVATALMDPLGLTVSFALGSPVPPVLVVTSMFLPTAIAAAAAIVGSRVVSELSEQAGRARELGSYRLVALIGHGGMGEVWRAEHRMLARDAAIKLVRGGADASGRELMARFEREAKATAALRSPHTVQLYDFGRSDDGAFYYVMELLEGFTLEEIVRRFGPLPGGRVVHLLRQVCHSLAEAHAAGLVHRDIKPGNIFVCRYGGDPDFVKVLDFGLVKTLAASAADLTQTGLLAGTPAYMPPEMALGRAVDGRTDLYALGAVGYTLLTGLPVFDRKTALETIHDHASTPPVPPGSPAWSGSGSTTGIRAAALRLHHRSASSRVQGSGRTIPARRRSSARALSGLSFGSFARQSRRIRSSAGSTGVAMRFEGGTGGVEAWSWIVSRAVFRSKTGRPVRSVYPT
ncbi:MAG TPA: serine/threonine-protein kinase, partial [Thermoanaerobaculia bacterium]|nr:serine/threonine-protein kinase [Thermoanaerobaculia bacterium]